MDLGFYREYMTMREISGRLLSQTTTETETPFLTQLASFVRNVVVLRLTNLWKGNYSEKTEIKN